MADKKKSSAMDSVKEELGGKKETPPKKEVKHMHITKAANGGHVITHTHTHPEHHPDETHITKGDDELASHVMQNMGTPNPGEAEADPAGGAAAAGAGALPAGGAAPQAGTAPAAPIPGM